MQHIIFSKRKAHSISNGLLLISLAILIFTNFWWPGILLAIWISVASRQYLTGKLYYAIITTFIFIGLFFTALFKFNFDILAPVILAIAGIFIIFREYAYNGNTDGEEKSEEILDDADLDS